MNNDYDSFFSEWLLLLQHELEIMKITWFLRYLFIDRIGMLLPDHVGKKTQLRFPLNMESNATDEYSPLNVLSQMGAGTCV